ncbi:putative sporulation protein YyaC [Bacillus mesophilus]|uniref:Spore protease YyaC n=1 Tax=Bacillus mesophilus TaxID=1808955 RepID=A0A6M0QDG3_9BACI|nr:spore protease YyaC [Bacillus mesophilus]MBM7662222.1 putative sporulation protein YyaC [Bacillus mesophilus]NEY73138.1 spore protease YyaC [Bacillus mesophilus]
MNLRPNFFEKKGGESKINFDEDGASTKIAKEIVSHLPTRSHTPIAIVCIGTDRSTGDALGPLIGTKLEEKGSPLFHVYGTLDDPIHAVNLEDQLKLINSELNSPFIIGIDACLGRLKSVGVITVGDGPVKPGAGVKKELPPVGDIHITGIVNVSGFMEFFVLQNTRLNLVMKMASIISEGIFEASLLYKRKLITSKRSVEQLKQI